MDRIITTTAKVKENNKEMIKKALVQIGQGTKTLVAETTGLSVATCNTLLNELARSGEILEVVLEKKAAGAGRPSKTYRLNDQLSLICCFSLYKEGNQQILQYQIVDLLSNIISEKMLMENEITYSVIHAQLSSLLIEWPQIKVVIIGFSGTIGSSMIIDSSELSSLVGISLIKNIDADFALPVIMDTRMNLISYGLYRQKEYTLSKIAVALSFEHDKCTGAGLTINNTIVHGKTNFAGSIATLPLQPETTKRLLHAPVKLSQEEIIARSICLFIAVLNPDVLLLTGTGISITLIGPVTEACKKIIPEKHMPEIVFAQDVKGYYVTGLMEQGLSFLDHE